MHVERRLPASAIRTHLWPVLTLLVVTWGVYFQTLGHDFIINWDDNLYVLENPDIAGVSLEHLKRVFTSFYVGNYAPLQMLSYMLDYTLWGVKPAGYLFSNILFHSCNGLFFYWMLVRLGGNRLWAFFGAFIFLCHPVQVESVAWVSQRKNLLAMFCFLLSVITYLEYREEGPGRSGWYAASLVMFMLALLAKSVVVVLPLVLFLLDVCFASDSRLLRRWIDKAPYLLVAALFALLTVKAQSMSGGGLMQSGGGVQYYGGSLYATVLTMLPVMMRYLAFIVWPANLSALYAPVIKTEIDWSVAGAALCAVMLLLIGWQLYRRNRQLFFWYTLFFVGLLPVSQIIPLVTIMNDRYLYFPMLGAAAFIAWPARKVAVAPLQSRTILLGAVALFAISLPLLSARRAVVWSNAMTLWSDAVAKEPGLPFNWTFMLEAYLRGGKPERIPPQFQRDPRFRNGVNLAVEMYQKENKPAQAALFLRTLVAGLPGFAYGYYSLGTLAFQEGKLDEAETYGRKALALEPNEGKYRILLGHVAVASGRGGAARELYRTALATGSDDSLMRYYLACLEARDGRLSESLKELEQALKLGYDDLEQLDKEPVLAPVRGLPEFVRIRSGGVAGQRSETKR